MSHQPVSEQSTVSVLPERSYIFLLLHIRIYQYYLSVPSPVLPCPALHCGYCSETKLESYLNWRAPPALPCTSSSGIWSTGGIRDELVRGRGYNLLTIMSSPLVSGCEDVLPLAASNAFRQSYRKLSDVVVMVGGGLGRREGAGSGQALPLFQDLSLSIVSAKAKYNSQNNSVSLIFFLFFPLVLLLNIPILYEKCWTEVRNPGCGKC